MPVTIRLLELCELRGARHLWPGELEGFVAKLEADPNDRTTLGVMADWLAEDGEAELAAAVRYVLRRPEVELKPPADKQYGSWRLVGLNWQIDRMTYTRGESRDIPGAFAELAAKLAEARKELE